MKDLFGYIVKIEKRSRETNEIVKTQIHWKKF